MNSSNIELNQAATLESFADRLSYLMPLLCRAMVRHEQNHLTSGRITVPQFWALEHLLRRGPCQMSELAGALQLKGSTSTMLVNRLARLGLVRRERGRDDRRAVRVAVTARGRRIVRQIDGQKRASIMRMFRPLSTRERAYYLDLIEKLVSELREPTKD